MAAETDHSRASTGATGVVTSWRGLARNALLGPGPALHELAHVAVARRYADVTVEPGLFKSQVRIEWNDRVPVWGVVFTYLAPLLLGGVLLIASAPFVGVLAGLPQWAVIYLGVNFALLAGPSVKDVVVLMQIFAAEAGDQS